MDIFSFKKSLLLAHADGFITYEEMLEAIRSAMLESPHPTVESPTNE